MTPPNLVSHVVTCVCVFLCVGVSKFVCMHELVRVQMSVFVHSYILKIILFNLKRNSSII